VKEGAEREQQTLRAIDPDAVVEDGASVPQPSDLRVAPLVRSERRAPEGRAQADREPDGDARGERWGPPREAIDVRTALLAAVSFAIALAAAVFFFGLSLTPERYLLVLLVPALILGCARRYLLDFAAFAALILAYGELRGLAHLSHPRPYYAPPLRAEEFLFGGHVPSVDLQQWLWSGARVWYDNALLFVSRIHSIVPTTFAFVLWLRRRALFYRFAATILTLSYGAAVIYWLFPAAPPWAAAERGMIDATKIGSGHFGTSSVLGGIPSIADVIHPNPYAAVPSLHGGYAFLLLLFASGVAWHTRWRWYVVAVAAVYPILQSFAAVYTGNHYVVDLILGYACAAAAYFGVRTFWRARRWPGWDEDLPRVDRNERLASAAGGGGSARPGAAHEAAPPAPARTR
jgi:hypothetical protein